MILIPDKCIWVNTPRTGSQTIAKCAKRDGLWVHRKHHPPKDEIPYDLMLPVWTIIRPPFEQMLSWYSAHTAAPTEKGFIKFVESKQTAMGWDSERRLNPYYDITNKFFLYGENGEGIYLALREMGLSALKYRLIPHEGKGLTKKLDHLKTPEMYDLVVENYSADQHLYEEVQSNQRLPGPHLNSGRLHLP